MMSIFASLFLSCEKINQENGEQEKVTIGFSTILEGVELTSESFPTRASDVKNLYQVQVSYYPQGSTYSEPYAYGLFDDISLAKFELIKGYTYSFAIAVYKDGANQLSRFGAYESYKYGNKTVFTTISNEPVYDSSNSLEVDFTSGIVLKGQEAYTIPRIEKFYGSVDSGVINEATTISVECKRVSFGLRVSVNNLTKGSVLLENSSMGDITLTPTNTSFESIYSFYSATLAIKEGYDRGYGYPTKIYYVREDDMKELLYTLEEYQLRRNQISVLTINLKSQEPESDKVNGAFSLSYDAPSFSESPIVINQE